MDSSLRRFFYIVVFCAVLAAGSGCFEVFHPDQSPFKPLSDYEDTDESVVRLYGEYILGTPILHSSFAVKDAESSGFDRWEGWLASFGPFGYIQKNLASPGESVIGGNVFIIDELLGEDAEKVIDFIVNESPNYPCKDVFSLLQGPNSNSYVQWVLDNTGWDVKLPDTSWGKNIKPNCH